jgi:catechol 2,3-dioxygenase-like lactoylglutathione lyase family enzyme
LKPRIHVVTLAVDDLERSLAFYQALGLESPGIGGTEFVGDDQNPGGAVAMFQLGDGLILSLYGRDDLAKDAAIRVSPPQSGAFSLGHLVSTREGVDELLETAVAAGATATAEPHERPWGIYSAYFRDPDGHLWEIVWNPDLDPEAT